MLVDIILVLIFLISIIYTIKYRFIQLNFPRESRKALKNKSSYITFLMSLGAHIGAGNIVGVTTALIYGGPGALFWMIVCTIFTTIFSLMENTLGIKYRTVIDGEYRGGSSYYILKGLNSKTLAIIFSLFLVVSSTIFFGPIQVNAISEAINYLFPIDKIIIFIIIIAFCILVIFRGTKIITKFIEKIVPFMTLAFFLLSLIVILININLLKDVVLIIIKDAFNFKSGFIGVAVVGIKRSLFSNEAGLGTAPSINAMSDVDKPIRQGYLQVLACFIDTVIMCTMLGIMIIMYNIDVKQYDGADLSIYLFEVILGNYGRYIGCFFLFIFATATIVSGFYGSESNMLFLRTIKKISIRKLKLFHKTLFIGGIAIGVFMTTKAMWQLVDYGLVILGLVNIVIIIKLEKEFSIEIPKKMKKKSHKKIILST